MMPKHTDFEMIYKRFIGQYGTVKGPGLYSTFIESKEYDDTRPFPKSTERKELLCPVRGIEIKEIEGAYHVTGLIATTHIDDLDTVDGIDIPDMIPRPTLDSFSAQINNNITSRVMGVHHSEGRPINPTYYGEADIVDNPTEVIELSDGEYGLYVDTKLDMSKPETVGIIEDFESGDLNAFSITYDTQGFLTTDFNWINDKLVRVLNPETQLFGYTAASNPVNPNAVAMGYGFKEFKELVKKVIKIGNTEEGDKTKPDETQTGTEATKADDTASTDTSVKSDTKVDVSETKEFQQWKADKIELEKKEILQNSVDKITERVLKSIEVKEKVLNNTDTKDPEVKIPLEVKEFNEVVVDNKVLEIKEQFRVAGAVSDRIGLDWREATTSPAEAREFKNFGVNGTKLEFKGLGITTNQNSDTNYLQSGAELQDVYDPIIYNALNQTTAFWNVLAKDDFSKKGNNQVQFTLKTAANASATFYNGNSVATGNVTRLKYQTKFKKIQVGVSVDGDMIAAARGGPVSDVFAQEVMDSTMDMHAVVNAALFAEVGLETASAPIGLEYLTDSAGNTSLYNLTRTAANKLAPDSAGDTYINQGSTVVSMTNLRAAKRQAITEGAMKQNLMYVTSPTQGDMLRGKFDDSRRMLTARDTDFGFSTDLFIDGIPVFEDKDCNTDDFFLVDFETHRIGMWVPPTIEMLGKTSDSNDAYVKMYLCTYNRAPRRMVQIYGCATS